MSYQRQLDPAPKASSVQTYIVLYSGIRGAQSRRWHRFLRGIGERQIAGLYELKFMTQRLSNRLYEEAKIATTEGGYVKLYPICQSCEKRSWQVGGRAIERELDYFVV